MGAVAVSHRAYGVRSASSFGPRRCGSCQTPFSLGNGLCGSPLLGGLPCFRGQEHAHQHRASVCLLKKKAHSVGSLICPSHPAKACCISCMGIRCPGFARVGERIGRLQTAFFGCLRDRAKFRRQQERGSHHMQQSTRSLRFASSQKPLRLSLNIHRVFLISSMIRLRR
eukprot:18984_4